MLASCAEVGMCRDKEEDWFDTAVAGSSALRAAALRAFGVECATLLGAAAAEALVDIAKFYDSLDPVLLMRRLIDMNFPAVSLLTFYSTTK